MAAAPGFAPDFVLLTNAVVLCLAFGGFAAWCLLSSRRRDP